MSHAVSICSHQALQRQPPEKDTPRAQNQALAQAKLPQANGSVQYLYTRSLNASAHRETRALNFAKQKLFITAELGPLNLVLTVLSA